MNIAMDIKKEDLKKIEDVDNVVIAYGNYKITSEIDYLGSTNELKQIKSKTAELEGIRKSITQPMDESKKRIMDFFRTPLEKLAQIEDIIKRSMLSYQQEQEKLRIAEQARLDEIQRKEAEKLKAKAEKAEAKGNTEKAEALKQQAEMAKLNVPVVSNATPKVAGISTKQIWKFRIIDGALIPKDYLKINEELLGSVARATKGSLKIAGVEFYAENIISAGKS